MKTVESLLPNFRYCSSIFLKRQRKIVIRISSVRAQISSLGHPNTKQGCIATFLVSLCYLHELRLGRVMEPDCALLSHQPLANRLHIHTKFV